MKKLFLIIIFLLFTILAWPSAGFSFWENLPLPAGFDEEIEQKVEKEKDWDVFSDPGFSQPTNHFSPGEMVYIRIEASGPGDQEKDLRLLDAGKRELKRIVLNQSGADPYVYTAAFSSPAEAGLYYLDVKIKSQGFSYASQKNINVGPPDDFVSLVSEAESVVGQDRQKTATFTPEPLLTPEASPSLWPVEPPPPPSPPTDFFIIAFFQKILTRVFSFLKGIF